MLGIRIHKSEVRLRILLFSEIILATKFLQKIKFLWLKILCLRVTYKKKKYGAKESDPELDSNPDPLVRGTAGSAPKCHGSPTLLPTKINADKNDWFHLSEVADVSKIFKSDN